MKQQRRYTDEQILKILQQHQGGMTAKEIIRQHGSRSTRSIAGSASTVGSRRRSSSGLCRDNPEALKQVCREFTLLCKQLDLLNFLTRTKGQNFISSGRD